MEMEPSVQDWNPPLDRWELLTPSGEATSDGQFSANDVIEAWVQGRSQGNVEGRIEGRKEFRSQETALIHKALQDNAELARTLATEILVLMKQKAFEAYQVFLRFNDPFVFDLLIVVNEDSFIDDEFDDIYCHVTELERTRTTPVFQANVGFMPVGKNENNELDLDYTTLSGDGFNLRLSHLSEP